MKFDELKLLVAINRLKPKGDPVTDEARWKFAIRIRDTYTTLYGEIAFPWSVSEVIALAVSWRKHAATKMKAEVANVHGYKCFWTNRNKGPCWEEVEGGHVVARANGGGDLSVVNGRIEWRTHNNQRRARNIDAYLMS